MTMQRVGQLIWKDAKVEWRYESFRDEQTFELKPHFWLKLTDQDGSSIEWPEVQIDTDELHDSLKGITDFTKLPPDLMGSILDNCVLKLREEQPAITRITPDA